MPKDAIVSFFDHGHCSVLRLREISLYDHGANSYAYNHLPSPLVVLIAQVDY